MKWNSIDFQFPGFSFFLQLFIIIQIYVDWKNTDNSPFVDLPNECADVTVYTASLAHKANHSFVPNCQFVAVDHPRYERIVNCCKKRETILSLNFLICLSSSVMSIQELQMCFLPVEKWVISIYSVKVFFQIKVHFRNYYVFLFIKI